MGGPPALSATGETAPYVAAPVAFRERRFREAGVMLRLRRLALMAFDESLHLAHATAGLVFRHSMRSLVSEF